MRSRLSHAQLPNDIGEREMVSNGMWGRQDVLEPNFKGIADFFVCTESFKMSGATNFGRQRRTKTCKHPMCALQREIEEWNDTLVGEDASGSVARVLDIMYRFVAEKVRREEEKKKARLEAEEAGEEPEVEDEEEAYWGRLLEWAKATLEVRAEALKMVGVLRDVWEARRNWLAREDEVRTNIFAAGAPLANTRRARSSRTTRSGADSCATGTTCPSWFPSAPTRTRTPGSRSSCWSELVRTSWRTYAR